MNAQLLILSLPTDNTAVRMRCWRAVKAMGAAVLRDGVYALPASESHEAALRGLAEDVRQHQGQAYVLPTAVSDAEFLPLFDRTTEFGAWMVDLVALRDQMGAAITLDLLKPIRKLRKGFEQLVAIDFFPGEAQRQARAALDALEQQAYRLLTPDEPRALDQALPRLRRQDFKGRIWATRARPWVDRLASAWLIRRFIDPEARFLWLSSPADCPEGVLGFDFDGARFSHVGARVTFETLLASFDLETPALLRLGLLVHALDAGGVQPPEAVGVERVLAGMREALTDDDQLLQISAGVFEGLLRAFEQERLAPGVAEADSPRID